MKSKLFMTLLLCSLPFITLGCSKTSEIEKTSETPTEILTASVTEESEKLKTTDESISLSAEEKAELIMAEMTLEEKVGQLFFARCPEISPVDDVSNYALGGYILFGRDFKEETPLSVKSSIESYQSASEIPLLIGVDEEGGNVVRVSKYPAFKDEPFLSPQQLFAKGGFDEIKKDSIQKSLFLKELGINVNLAPVCDISTDPKDFIYNRSFGQNAENTSTYVSIVVTEMKTAKIGSVLKHFPGYGNNTDTHTGIAYDKRPLEQFIKEDFLPFKAGINVGVDSILVSHNVIECIDPNFPASLSSEVNRVLREDLGFNGVIMTDDMAMEGVKNFSETDTAVLAIIANYDMIITSDHQGQIAKVLEAVKKGEISDSHINSSVKRILVWKINLGLID